MYLLVCLSDGLHVVETRVEHIPVSPCAAKEQPSETRPRKGFSQREFALQLEIFARCTNNHAVRTLLCDPTGVRRIPERHGILIEGKADNFSRSRGEIAYFGESAKLKWRVRDVRLGKDDVELNGFGSFDVAGILDRQGDFTRESRSFARILSLHQNCQIRVLKCRVRQTESKGNSDLMPLAW